MQNIQGMDPHMCIELMWAFHEGKKHIGTHNLEIIVKHCLYVYETPSENIYSGGVNIITFHEMSVYITMCYVQEPCVKSIIEVNI